MDDYNLKTIVNLEFFGKNAVKGEEKDHIIIVIDVLRCSSTIIAALANGATGIIPVETIKEALSLRETNPQFLLAGERNGIKPISFDMGNSPLEFKRRKVSGRQIVITTTNGTRALARSQDAKWVLIGAFLNTESVAKKATLIAQKEGVGISIISSGKKSSFSLEDFICAGAIVDNLKNGEIKLSDAAIAASLSFEHARSCLYETVMKGEHAKYLTSLGFIKDIEFSCKYCYYSIVPIFLNGRVMCFDKIFYDRESVNKETRKKRYEG